MKTWLLLSLLSWHCPAFAQGFYDLVESDINGQELRLSDFRGKVILVVNIASQCAFTSQLEGLQTLYSRFKSRGLVVLGVPSNEFGEQTPEVDADMKSFCQKKYQVSFPLLSKGHVNGSQRRALYRYLTSLPGMEADIGWNFVKFLVDRRGRVVERWSALTGPSSDRVIDAIEKALLQTQL